MIGECVPLTERVAAADQVTDRGETVTCRERELDTVLVKLFDAENRSLDPEMVLLSVRDAESSLLSEEVG